MSVNLFLHPPFNVSLKDNNGLDKVLDDAIFYLCLTWRMCPLLILHVCFFCKATSLYYLFRLSPSFLLVC